MKVLYVGVYRDSTGWGNMAINSMMALIEAGIDVTARPVKLNNACVDLPQQILEAEAKKGGNFDVVIQNVLPHMFDYNGKIPINIGYYCTETNRCDFAGWPKHINTMDRAWVCSEQSYDASWVSGVKVPIDIIPIACDISKYQRMYNPLSIRDRMGDSFVFYYIGDFNKRKNLVSLIKAFHMEFDVDEPVSLLLKTNIGSGVSDDFDNVRSKEAILQEIERVKVEMKLYSSPSKYKKEIVIVGNYSDEDIMRLHATCDCFVCPSYGEAWCVPAFDAMAMGRVPITTSFGGFLEYNSNETGWLVGYRKEPVWGMSQGSLPDMYTSRESWASVDVYDLCRCMREAYENKDLRDSKSLSGRERAYDFSYSKVGSKMKEAISGLC